MKVLIHTFGCQMNKLDSELVWGELVRAGYTLAGSEDEADIILFNTCSVRRHAEERVYSWLGALKKLKSQKPELIIGVMGCMAQREKEKILKRVPFVNIICGPHRHQEIPDLIMSVIANGRQPVISVSEKGLYYGSYYRNPTVSRNQSQAYVLVMRGCDNYCSYCIVPYVRGREISRPIPEIIDEIKLLADNGCKEITLLGQSITSYGKSLVSGVNLARLLEAADQVTGIERIRFVTSHPAYASKELFQAMRDLPKVCEYLHMPAQSGSNRILKAMNRGYTVEQYLETIARARELVPGIEIVSDFIVGFSGEQDKDFQDTVDFIQQAKFYNCFVFKYSPRPGTKATELKDDIPVSVKKERNNILLQIQLKISQERNTQMIGQTVEVLVVGASKTNATKQSGRTRTNYIVIFPSNQDLKGQLVRVKITSATDLTLYGELV